MLPFVITNEVYRYYRILNPDEEVIPEFLMLYCMTPSVSRLEGVGYFCGADYHKIESQRPKYFYSRFDHSLACALMTWHLTHNRQKSILALLHDIGTPCFSHAIDYGMKDSEKQESSERNIVKVIEEDSMLSELLYLDGIDYRAIDFRKEPLIDNQRPKLCVDRLEGIFSSNLIWSQTMTLKDIKNIYQHITIVRDDNKEELGFDLVEAAKLSFKFNDIINQKTEAKEDILTMSLLGDIMMYGIRCGCFTKHDLYHLTEREIIDKIKKSSNTHLKHYFHTYCSLTKVEELSFDEQTDYYIVENRKVKKRQLDPLVEMLDKDPVRLSQIDSKISNKMVEYENEPIISRPFIKLLWKQKRRK